MKTKFRILAAVAPVALASFLGVGSAEAVQFTFAPDGVDVTYSLGQFKILIDPFFNGGVSGATYTSPVLFDNNTQIQHTQVDATHVNTQVLQFNMTNGAGTSLTAGGAALPGTNPSLGLVTSTGAPGFPANSTFNMYVNAWAPGLPAGSVLYNPFPNPLLINAPAPITQFPPDIVYIHGSSSAVPIYLHQPLGSVDRLFGYLTLAGHGVLDVNAQGAGGTTPGNIAQDLSQFQAQYPAFSAAFSATMASLTDAPITTEAPTFINTQLPLPATLWLFGIGMAGMGVARKRKQAA